MARVGRPSKLTPEVKAKILQIRKLGLPSVRACAVAGVGNSTYFAWLAKAQADKEAGRRSEYLDFLEELEQALNEGAAVQLAYIEAAAKAGDWRAAAHKLKLMLPDDFGDVQRTEVSGPGGDPLQVNHSGFVAYVPRAAASEDEWSQEVGQSTAAASSGSPSPDPKTGS